MGLNLMDKLLIRTVLKSVVEKQFSFFELRQVQGEIKELYEKMHEEENQRVLALTVPEMIKKIRW